MKCFCFNSCAVEDDKDSPTDRHSVKSKAGGTPKPEELSVAKDREANGTERLREGTLHRKLETPEKDNAVAVLQHSRKSSVLKAAQGEQVAAGWPPWLAAVAGEAISGWLPRRADSFEKLDKIGQGTYSNVYRARDLSQNKIVALKKVRFDNLEPESVRFMAREILILRRLDHPNVVKLEGLVTSRMSSSLYLVFEYMEHDLAGLASHLGLKFSESQVKCYTQQLLRGLEHCHSHGVLHRDIKSSNLLIDNNGILKIADFGLGNFYNPQQTQPLTSRVVTLWYRPPELLLGATSYGPAVDLWSAGCILAELYAGKPIMPGRTEVEQLHKIFKLCGSPSEDYWNKSKLPHATMFKPQQPYRRAVAETFREFPTPALALIERLLSIDPDDRGSAATALESEFFTTKPLPCDPSSLPKYQPSKELDARMRDEEARKQGAATGNKSRRHPERRNSKASLAVPAPNTNAELAASRQRRHIRARSGSRSEKFSPYPERTAPGFQMDPPRQSHALEPNNNPQSNLQKRAYSGPLVFLAASAKGSRNCHNHPKMSADGDFSGVLGLVAIRPGSSQQEAYRGTAKFYESFKEASETNNGTNQKDDGRSKDKDPVQNGYGSKARNIQYSGPLVVASGNMDQALKDRDQHIQEAVRRARIDKAKFKRIQAGTS